MAVSFVKYAKPIPFGIVEPKPLRGFPSWRAKIKMRNEEFVRIYVKTANGIQCWIPKEENGFWVPGHNQGENKRVTTRPR